MAVTPVELNGINRLLATMNFLSNSNLNISPTDLSEEGIEIRAEEEAVTPLRGMTGFVNSPKPYWGLRSTVHILKSSPAVSAWLDATKQNATIGRVVVYPDSTMMGTFELHQCSIQTFGTVNLNGSTAFIPFELFGSQVINKIIWDEA
ncbi:unnamed protein product [Commensalibacter communis]|uniref:Uncharacterized protein n=1 Tax=Commensalibacter communis TaxID=2972786 RepID=A0A9W4TR09_9PROT|nr:hypothetical protein [Commensalibacter communis]CAI3958096.1 unnamed protein product [Commensalibacter communis]CAI3960070.1 unnamed protein product [Commensalibacter communis]